MKTFICNFFVPGIPATAGSKTGFYNPKAKRVIMAPANKRQKPWMAVVRLAATEAYSGPPLTGPIAYEFWFYLPRPRSHFGSGKNSDKLKTSAPAYPTTKPDLTKMVRAVEDALTGVLWKDDSQVVSQRVVKRYHDHPGKPGVWVWASEVEG